MVNPGGFSGLRKEFLDAQQSLYAAAVGGKHTADTIADIQRRYFKRFPVTLPHNEDPAPEYLASVDDDTPDAELSAPQPDGMDDEQYARAQRVYQLQVAEITMRKAQIKRRLQYVYNKVKAEKSTFEIGSNDPMAILMSKLTGNSLHRPRLKTPFNLWGPQNRHIVDPVFAERIKQRGIPARQHATLRSSLYKELFEELPQEVQQRWVERAEREHQEALEKVNEPLQSGPSASPADRQRVIEALPKFVQPVLDLIADHTGWKVTLIAGGPEPADSGRLNMVSVHSGVTSGSVKMNFGRSERLAYKEFIVPTFGKFLKKCYSVQECREMALPEDADFSCLAASDIHGDVEIFTFDDGRVHDSEQYIRLAPPRPKGPAKASTAAHQPSTGVKRAAAPPQAPSAPSKATSPSSAPSVKIGPPVRCKRRPTANSMAASAPIAQQMAHTEEPTSVTGALSRAPTPLISRPPTPIPSTTDSAALCITPEPAHPFPCSSPAKAAQRSMSVVPMGSMPAAAALPGRAFSVAPRGVELAPLVTAPPQVPDSRMVHATYGMSAPTPVSAHEVADKLASSTSHPPSGNAAPAHKVAGKPVNSASHPCGTVAVPNLQNCAQPEPRRSIRKRKESPVNPSPTQAKKQRTGGRSKPSSDVTGQPVQPPWISGVLEMLRSTTLGPEWDQLVADWFSFEHGANFANTGKLGTFRRPQVVSAWIRRARSATFRPVIDDLATFAADFDAWWRALQPGWRGSSDKDGNADLGCDEGDWSALRQPGINGLVSVLAALFFWGLAAQKQPTEKTTWLRSVTDVSCAVAQLI